MAFGGLVAMTDRRYRERARENAAVPTAAAPAPERV
jgi:hypothetical protein